MRIPQVQVAVDYQKAGLYGVAPSHVTEALETLLNGRVVSQIIDGNRRYDVVLRVADADRTTEGLSRLIVETPAGRVPLSSFAQVVETDGPNQIQRDNTRRRIVVLANTDGSDMARIIGDIRGCSAELQLPAGYSTTLEGTFQAQEEASRLIGLLSLAVAGGHLHRALQPLPVGGAVAHHHGQHPAGPDRQRRRACGSPASRCRSPP